MSVNSVCPCCASQDVNQAGSHPYGGPDLRVLRHALDAGDIAVAQEAIATLQKNLQNVASRGNPAALLDPESQSARDFQALQTAIQMGDFEAAKSALAAIKHDLKSAPPASERPACRCREKSLVAEVWEIQPPVSTGTLATLSLSLGVALDAAA